MSDHRLPILTRRRRRYQLIRLSVALLFAGVSYFAFQPGRTPPLSSSGFLGVINVVIIVFLLALTFRQFLFLFFSSREEIRRERRGPATHLPAISILVPSYNEGVVIQRTIAELLHADYPEFEVIVVDDGSTDQTLALAQQAAVGHANIRVFSKPNSGKANTLNFALQHARHPLVFCMDADSHLRPHALRAGVRHLADPRVGAVAGSVLVLNQKNAITRFQTMEYLTGLNFYKTAQSFLGLVTIIPGPSGLFRRDVLQELGGYAPDTFAEDCDLTLRILMSGRRVIYEPDMEVQTEVPENVAALIRQRYRWNRGILQATRKHLRVLLHFWSEPASAMVVAYMLFEGIALPVINVGVAALSLTYQVYSNDFSLFSLWLVQLTLLDLSVMIVTLTDIRWPMRLIAYASINRFTYSFFQDIIKIMSSVEEFLGIHMTWGKLDRVGEN